MIEMGLLRKYLKCAVIIFFTLNSPVRFLGLLLCIFVAQGAAKLPKFKVGSLKNQLTLVRVLIDSNFS